MNEQQPPEERDVLEIIEAAKNAPNEEEAKKGKRGAGKKKYDPNDPQWYRAYEAEGCLWRDAPTDELDPETGRVKVRREKLTDCLVDVACAHERAGTHEFEVVLTRNGDSFHGMLPMKVLEDNKAINAWAASVGRCNWNLWHAQRKAVKDWIMSRPGANRVVHRPTFVGVDTDTGVVLANGHSFSSDGWIRKGVSDGSFALACTDKKEREFRLKEIEFSIVPNFATIDERMLEGRFAELGPEAQEKGRADALMKARMEMRYLVDAFQMNLTRHAGAIALGWGIANLFYPEIQRAHRQFPHCYFVGKFGCGKDTLAQWIWEVVGLGHAKPMPATETSSSKGLRNIMEAVCGFPHWINELRKNEEHCMRLMGTIRAMFDGQSGMVATKDHGLRQFSIRRGLMMSGQDVLGADADQSRYVLIELHRKWVKADKKPVVEAAVNRARAAFPTLVAHRAMLAKQIIPVIRKFEEALDTAVVETSAGDIPVSPSSRQRLCWAVALAGLAITMSPYAEQDPVAALPDGVWREALLRMVTAESVAATDGTLGGFWSELESLQAEGRLPCRGDSRWWQVGETDSINEAGEVVKHRTVALWLTHLRRAFNNSARPKTPLSSSFLRAEFEDMPGFVAIKEVKLTDYWEGKTVSRSRECVIIDVDVPRHGLPTWLLESIPQLGARDVESGDPPATPERGGAREPPGDPQSELL